MRAVVLLSFLGGVITHKATFDHNQDSLVRFNTTFLPARYLSENPSAYNYHEQYGTKVAAKIRKSEGIRLTEGDLALNEHVPYMGGLAIVLEDGYISVCGSSLLSNTKLVTAAHCWWDGKSQAHSFTVVLGSNMLFVGGIRIATRTVAPHHKWRPESDAQNDIAIITIPVVSFTEKIRPIDLPSGSLLRNTFAGKVAQATGFGILADVQEWEWFLYNVELKVMKNSECSKYWDSLVDTMMCTNYAKGRSTCHGDMGGPLVYSDDGREVLIGIASFVSQLGCQVGRPAGYTRIAPYVKWIQLYL